MSPSAAIALTTAAVATTPASFWTYHAEAPTPSHDDAIACGAISSTMSLMEWEGFSPGMRRAIVRDHLRRPVRS